MNYIKLGTSDLEVSRICLGCMSLGDASKGMHTWAVPYDESKAVIGYAYENGINFLILQCLTRLEPVRNIWAGR